MRDSQLAARKQHAFALRLKLRMAAQIVLVSLLPLTMIVYLVGGGLWRVNFRQRDLASAPLQTGTALVTNITQVSSKRGFNVNLTFRLHEHTTVLSVMPGGNTDDDERLIWTKVGDTVPVTYRVGKSGAIYIENWQAPPHKVPLSR